MGVEWVIIVEECGVSRGRFKHEFTETPVVGEEIAFDRAPCQDVKPGTFVVTSVNHHSYLVVITLTEHLE